MTLYTRLMELREHEQQEQKPEPVPFVLKDEMVEGMDDMGELGDDE